MRHKDDCDHGLPKFVFSYFVPRMLCKSLAAEFNDLLSLGGLNRLGSMRFETIMHSFPKVNYLVTCLYTRMRQQLSNWIQHSRQERATVCQPTYRHDTAYSNARAHMHTHKHTHTPSHNDTKAHFALRQVYFNIWIVRLSKTHYLHLQTFRQWRCEQEL